MIISQEDHHEIAEQISEMANRLYGVPRDEMGIKTADDCALMLQVLSSIAIESTDEPFIPPPPGAESRDG